jgi:hypothetical protein
MTRIVIAALSLAAWPAGAEVFIDVGAAASRVDSRFAGAANTVDSSSSGLHVGVGARRSLSGDGDLSVRVELDSIDSDLLIAVRALDYRYNLSDRLAVNAFLGAARLDRATPAYGYYAGGGVQLKEIFPRWDLSIDLRFGEKVARDNLLPSDPQGPSPDNFHDISSISVYFSFGF